jgi:hypothetical protein
MKKIIKLTESDLIDIVKRVLEEQSVMGTPYFPTISATPKKIIKTYSCVPDSVNLFVDYVMTNKNLLMKKLNVDYKTLILLTKASIGIMGRETKFGNYTEFSDTASEKLRGIGLGSIFDWGIKKYNQYSGEKPITQSLGMAQFTPKTWERYGLDKSIGDYNSSFNTINQGLGVLYSLNNRYKKALSNGLKPEPSVNPILSKYGLLTKINGTGNHALDMSILSHNMPEEKTIYPYCTTNHPLYASPCYKSKTKPYNDKESFKPNSKLLQKVTDPKLKQFPGELIVNQTNIITNYFPNLSGPDHSGIGYVEEVAKYIKSYNCF